MFENTSRAVWVATSQPIAVKRPTQFFTRSCSYSCFYCSYPLYLSDESPPFNLKELRMNCARSQAAAAWNKAICRLLKAPPEYPLSTILLTPQPQRQQQQHCHRSRLIDLTETTQQQQHHQRYNPQTVLLHKDVIAAPPPPPLQHRSIFIITAAEVQ